MTERGAVFSSRWGMMLAMLGMAIGTGNIWRFPRVAASNGGGAFLVAWVVFLLFSGACNIVVAYGCEEKTWVNFRMFGMIGMSVVFVGAQMFWILKWVRELDEEALGREASTSEAPPDL